MSREENLCWFHGKISRERAEEILRETNQGDGVFLVRESNTSSGDFVLSVLYQDQVLHYQIRRHGEDAFFSIDDHTKIHGLDSLIEHYQQSSNGLVTQLKSMVKCDPPPNDSRSHGKTNLLHRATRENNQTVVSELLKCRYRNFDAKNQDGQTVVHLACIYSTEEILKLLIKVGANVNSRDTSGNTPLHYACRNKPANFIKTLISANANIQNRNIENGYVPLHDAAKFGNMEAVQELLKSKAPHMPRTDSGEFPSDLAKENGHIEIETFLLQYEPPPATTFKYQWYHGTLDRTEAIELLTQYEKNLKERLMANENNPDTNENQQNKSTTNDNEKLIENNNQKQIDASGIFLVRYSHRSGYVLTLLCEGQARNFIIQKSMKYLYIDQGPYMISLEHLIQHYMTFSDGLPVNLRYPVQPKPKPPLPLFSTMPKSVSSATKRQHQNILNTKYSPDGHDHNSNTDEFHNCRLPRYNVQHFRRNLSQLDDSAMNKVGLFDSNNDGENDNNAMKKRDMHIFRSLKPRSTTTKRNIIIDGMKSLRKAKLKSENNTKRKMSNDESRIQDNSLHLAESLIKNLSFSTDFLNQTTTSTTFDSNNSDSFYNIPKNNCAVIDIDIGENPNNSILSNNQNENSNLNEEIVNNDVNNKQQTPLQEEENTKKRIDHIQENDLKSKDDYFTKSDTEICLERDSTETSFFIDVPSSATLPTKTTVLNPTVDNITSPTFTGYVPTVDIRVFLENTNEENKILAETSAAELREFSKHPERLDSMISNISSDSELSGFFNRQISLLSTSTSSSSIGTTTTTAAAAAAAANGPMSENSRIKLNYFIPNECLTLDEIIGEGEFGSVYKGSLKYADNNENNKDRDKDNSNNGGIRYYVVAIKTLRDEHCRTNKQEFLREASVMIQLQHHCIVKLIGISKGKTLMMVQELVPLGSMLNYILNNPEKINPNYELKIWASQIACGMNYLESQHFVHRDLAARNILLASRHQIKISDFGLSRALSSGNSCYQASQGGKWPIKWYAPESFNHGCFSHASDVWSFGITLWEMFSLGQAPYGDMRGVDAIKLIEKGYRLSQPKLCPDNVYKIMENCWNYNPKDRPTFRYLTEYFSKDPEYQNLSELIKSEHIS